MIPLHEQYRPLEFSEVVGQQKAIGRFEQVAKRGIGGRAYWLSGKSGTGKTTIARLIAANLADWINTREIDARDLTISDIRDVERTMYQYGMGERTGRAWIFNEAHRLRADVVSRLLTTMESIPDHVAVIFTTTADGQAKFEDGFDAKPFLSRCVMLPLAQQGLAIALAGRARAIAQREGLDGKPIEAYVRLVNKHGANMRAVLQAIEAGEMAD